MIQLATLGENEYFDLPTRKSYISIIHRNAVLSMYMLIKGASEKLHLKLNNTKACQKIVELKDYATLHEYWKLTDESAALIKELWATEEGLSTAYRHRHKLEYFVESSKYWFENIDRLSKQDYVPTMDDIYRMRIKTTGIVEAPVKNKNLELADLDTPLSVTLVGSQRNERKKWVHAFEGVTAIVFVVALSEYNQVLYEDGTTNRMKESLLLYSEIVNSARFENTPIYLYFNKQDVFLETIAHFDLMDAFGEEVPPSLRRNADLVPFLDRMYSSHKDLLALVSRKTPSLLPILARSKSKEQAQTVVPKLKELPVEILSLICLYLEPNTLCKLSRTNVALSKVVYQDFIWQTMAKRICPTISNEVVEQVYKDHFVPAAANQVGRLEDKKPWHFIYQFGFTHFQRSIDFIMNKFETQTDRKDIPLYVTTAVDSDLVKPVLESTLQQLFSKHKQQPVGVA